MNMCGMGCTLYIRCELSIHQMNVKKFWGVRYTKVRVIYWRIRYVHLLHLQHKYKWYSKHSSLI
jgi:hypothetical protein